VDFYSKINKEIEDFRSKDAFRFLKQERLAEGGIIDLATNDYLGLAQEQDLLERFYSKENKIQLTASSSRLLSGNHKYYTEVEQKLSCLYDSKSALFFNSGYHLNIGVLPSVTTKKDLILADKLVHASLIESFKLSSAKIIRYKHLDYLQLENLLEKYKDDFENIFIVSESIFSMDGDKVDLQKIVKLKNKYSAYLYLDEAHAVGVFGNKGLGLAEQEGLLPEIDFLVGTMGKALASVGAFLICSEDTKTYLVNTCKSLIYTTALPPVNMAWTAFVLGLLPSFSNRRKNLKEKVDYFRQKLIDNSIEVEGESHIFAIIVGENKSCLELARLLKEEKIEVQAVRPPTVPEGTSRIRISLHEKLSFDDLDKLVKILKAHI